MKWLALLGIATCGFGCSTSVGADAAAPGDFGADLSGLPAHCANGTRDGDESDVDCGGACPRCPTGKACVHGGDCDSGACQNSVCLAPRCGDGIKNGGETDLDCGGMMCAKCAAGQACVLASDCQTANCFNNVCGAPSGELGGPADLAAPTADMAEDLAVAFDVGGMPDLSSAPPDLALPPDLATPSDSAAADLAARPDLATPPDFAGADRASKPDLATAPDLATVPDLAMAPDLVAPDLMPAPDLAGPVALTLSFAAPTTSSTPSLPNVMLLGLLNGDKSLDLVQSTNSGNDFYTSLMLGKADGTFGAATKAYNQFGGSTGTRARAIGDFNGDGKNDVLATSTPVGNVSPSPQLYFFAGDGNGGLGQGMYVPIDDGMVGLSAGDWNADGKLDIAEAFGSNQISVNVRLGKNDGTFQPPQLVLNMPARFGIGDPLVADFNGDQKLDLGFATADGQNQTPQLSVALGNGDGTFKAPATINLPKAGLCASVDINGDGRPDVAVLADTGLNVLIGVGDGTFKAPLATNVPFWINAAFADFDSDGKMDFATMNGSVNVSRGNGDGTFKMPYTFSCGDNGPLAAGDFNLDGKPDVIVLVGSKSQVNVCLNTSK